VRIICYQALCKKKLTKSHRITHNVHQDHDEKFHALLDQLVWEFSELRRSGYNGEGFYYADGQKLGGGQGLYNPELTELRKQAISRGEGFHCPPAKPVQTQSTAVLPPSHLPKPPRLRGRPVQKGDRNRIAEAAEKRRREAERCGLGHGEGEMNAIIKRGMVNGIHEKPEPLSEDEMAAVMIQIQMLEEAGNEARIENGGQIPPYMLISGNEADEIPAPPYNDKQGQNVSTGSRTPNSSLTDTRPSPRRSSDTTSGGANHGQARAGNGSQWACWACTLVNPDTVLRCELCETRRR